MSQTQAGLSVSIIDPQTGRILPKFDPCNITRAEGFRLFREAMGQALGAAEDSLGNLQGAVDTASASLADASTTVDQLLSQNPDSSTPDSLRSLTIALGGLSPTTDSDELEGRVAELFDLNVVGGVLFPKGASDLGGFRRMFQSLEINTDLCSIPNTSGDFIFVTAFTETIETIVGEVCGEPIVEFTVIERKIGENISIQRAAELRAIQQDDVLIRFYWLNEVKNDRATQIRLKALGIRGSDLTNVIMAPKDEGRVFSTIVDTTDLDKLRVKLTDSEICNMMNRPDTRSNLNLEPTADEVLSTVRSTLNTNTGTSRNRAGTGEDSITPSTSTGAVTPSGPQIGSGGTQPKATDSVAPAGRAGDPALLIFATVNFPRSLGLERVGDDVQIDRQSIDITALPDGCTELFNFVGSSLSALEQFSGEAQAAVADVFGRLALGTQQLSAGLDFSSCLVSASLGLNASLNLTNLLPFQLDTFLAAFSVALTAAVTAIDLIKKFLCVPLAVIQLLFGGVCGFKPFNFDACTPDLAEAIDRLKSLINITTSLLTSVLSALQVMKTDISASGRKALELKIDSECAAGAAPLGIALGLLGSLTTGDLTASASVAGVSVTT